MSKSAVSVDHRLFVDSGTGGKTAYIGLKGALRGSQSHIFFIEPPFEFVILFITLFFLILKLLTLEQSYEESCQDGDVKLRVKTRRTILREVKEWALIAFHYLEFNYIFRFCYATVDPHHRQLTIKFLMFILVVESFLVLTKHDHWIDVVIDFIFRVEREIEYEKELISHELAPHAIHDSAINKVNSANNTSSISPSRNHDFSYDNLYPQQLERDRSVKVYDNYLRTLDDQMSDIAENESVSGFAPETFSIEKRLSTKAIQELKRLLNQHFVNEIDNQYLGQNFSPECRRASLNRRKRDSLTKRNLPDDQSISRRRQSRSSSASSRYDKESDDDSYIDNASTDNGAPVNHNHVSYHSHANDYNDELKDERHLLDAYNGHIPDRVARKIIEDIAKQRLAQNKSPIVLVSDGQVRYDYVEVQHALEEIADEEERHLTDRVRQSLGTEIDQVVESTSTLTDSVCISNTVTYHQPDELIRQSQATSISDSDAIFLKQSITSINSDSNENTTDEPRVHRSEHKEAPLVCDTAMKPVTKQTEEQAIEKKEDQNSTMVPKLIEQFENKRKGQVTISVPIDIHSRPNSMRASRSPFRNIFKSSSNDSSETSKQFHSSSETVFVSADNSLEPPKPSASPTKRKTMFGKVEKLFKKVFSGAADKAKSPTADVDPTLDSPNNASAQPVIESTPTHTAHTVELPKEQLYSPVPIENLSSQFDEASDEKLQSKSHSAQASPHVDVSNEVHKMFDLPGPNSSPQKRYGSPSKSSLRSNHSDVSKSPTKKHNVMFERVTEESNFVADDASANMKFHENSNGRRDIFFNSEMNSEVSSLASDDSVTRPRSSNSRRAGEFNELRKQSLSLTPQSMQKYMKSSNSASSGDSEWWGTVDDNGQPVSPKKTPKSSASVASNNSNTFFREPRTRTPKARSDDGRREMTIDTQFESTDDHDGNCWQTVASSNSTPVESRNTPSAFRRVDSHNPNNRVIRKDMVIMSPLNTRLQSPSVISGGISIASPMNSIRTSNTMKYSIESFTEVLCRGKRIILLGDVSTSMNLKDLMKNLQRSMRCLGHECVRNDDEDPDSETVDTCRISLGLWSDSVHWLVPEGSWITSHKKLDSVLKSMNSITARGGKDLRTSIMEAMEAYEDCSDICVLCDGIPWPFDPYKKREDVNGDISDWSSFRKQFNDKKFHFVALGLAADRKKLHRMAKEGDGAFCMIKF